MDCTCQNNFFKARGYPFNLVFNCLGPVTQITMGNMAICPGGMLSFGSPCCIKNTWLNKKDIGFVCQMVVRAALFRKFNFFGGKTNVNGSGLPGVWVNEWNGL